VLDRQQDDERPKQAQAFRQERHAEQIKANPMRLMTLVEAQL
jgi:hypothetical protein